MITDSDDYVGRLHWIRSERNVQASVILRERKGKGRKRGKPKQLVVIVPAAWKFIEKVEKVRDETPGDQICELIANCTSLCSRRVAFCSPRTLRALTRRPTPTAH